MRHFLHELLWGLQPLSLLVVLRLFLTSHFWGVFEYKNSFIPLEFEGHHSRPRSPLQAFDKTISHSIIYIVQDKDQVFPGHFFSRDLFFPCYLIYLVSNISYYLSCDSNG